MSKIFTVLPLLGFALWSCGRVVAADDEAQPLPIAHFRFNGNAKNDSKQSAEFELKNTVFNASALYLNGQYEFGDAENGYRAVCKTPMFAYAAFTVALRFKAEEFAQGKTNIFVGGTSYRWFAINRAESGNLTITLNNQSIVYEVKNAPIDAGKWTVVACGVDLPARRIVAYVNGKKAAEFELPKDFKLEVVGSAAEESDKNWSFTNYSNGNVFHGFVDELIVHNRTLTDDEFIKIPLKL